VTMVVSPDPLGIASNLVFPITVACTSPTGGHYALNVHGNISSAPINNLTVGSRCSVAETLPSPPQGCTWQAPIYSPATVTIAGGMNTVTVTNSYTCTPQSGYLNIYKSITNATWPNGTTFAFNANCSNGYNHTQSGLVPSTSWSLDPLPHGTTCTITEPALPAPFTNAQGQTCTWHQQAPLSQTVTINGPTQSVTVTNSFTCAQQDGSLTVQKVVNPDPKGIGSMPFPMTVTCTNPTGNYPLTVQGNSTAAPINLPVGSNCTIAESNRPPLPAGCGWLPPQYSPQSVTIAPGTNAATVTNGYDCSPEGSLIVTKTVKNITGSALPSISFPVTVKCSLPPLPAVTVPFNLTDGGSHTVNNIVVGSICTVTEVLPPPPSNACPAGGVAVWSTPTYTPPSVMITIEPPPSLTVLNELNCEKQKQLGPAACDPSTTFRRGNECACRYPNMARRSERACACASGMSFVAGRGCIRPIECRPPLIPSAGGTACICPPGTVQRGLRCVRPIECRPPMVPNAAGTACACPARMVQRGGSCVQPTACNPPARLNRRGACECPANMVLRGYICVEQLRNPRDLRDGRHGPRDPRGGYRQYFSKEERKFIDSCMNKNLKDTKLILCLTGQSPKKRRY
jgi:hypothetical protein